MKSITRPVLGNHEEEGTGYFDYFNGKRERYGPAGERGKGYYSFDVGRWHLVALNSNCSMVSCSRGSAQERWLRADLAASRSSCTLAYWHHPRFTSWQPPDSNAMQAIWQVLYDAGAEVVLSGHSHHYERFAPQDVGAKLDRANGIRQFVVGGAGAFFTTLGTPRPNSELRNNRTFGVLKLTLHPTSYDWRFVPEAGKSFTDAGSELCHGGELAADYSAPGEPEDLTARPAGPLSVDLDWGAAVDNVAVTGYELFRDDELLAATASTSFSDTTIGRSATYSYRVRALDAAGNRSRFSNEVRVTISASGAVTIDSSPVDVRVGIPGQTSIAATSTALGRRAAIRLARKLLARQLGRVFTKRRSFRRSCARAPRDPLLPCDVAIPRQLVRRPDRARSRALDRRLALPDHQAAPLPPGAGAAGTRPLSVVGLSGIGVACRAALGGPPVRPSGPGDRLPGQAR